MSVNNFFSNLPATINAIYGSSPDDGSGTNGSGSLGSDGGVGSIFNNQSSSFIGSLYANDAGGDSSDLASGNLGALVGVLPPISITPDISVGLPPGGLPAPSLNELMPTIPEVVSDPISGGHVQNIAYNQGFDPSGAVSGGGPSSYYNGANIDGITYPAGYYAVMPGQDSDGPGIATSGAPSFAGVVGSSQGTTGFTSGWTSTTYSANGGVQSENSTNYNAADGQTGWASSQTGQIYSYAGVLQWEDGGSSSAVSFDSGDTKADPSQAPTLDPITATGFIAPAISAPNQDAQLPNIMSMDSSSWAGLGTSSLSTTAGPISDASLIQTPSYYFQPGYFAQAQAIAVQGYNDPGNTGWQQAGFAVLGALELPMAMVEEGVRGMANTAADADLAAQYFAAASQANNSYDSWNDFSSGLGYAGQSLLGATGLAGLTEGATAGTFIDLSQNVNLGSSWSGEAGSIVPDTIELPPVTSEGQADAAQYAQLKASYAAQNPGYVSQSTQIQNVSTFQTLGVDNATAQGYLATQPGQNMLSALWAADPSASDATIYARAVDQISTGTALPETQIMTTPLVKIVPEGASVSPYTPFFTTPEELVNASQSGTTIADYFGLPLSSESTTYSIYQISPTQPAGVFVNQVAPTTELNGLIQRSAGGAQYIVPNRGLWSDPVLIGTTNN